MSPPRVSVCIRTKDRPGPLRAAIAGVLAQTFTDFEVVVSSDGDPVDGLVAEFADPRVRATQHPGPPSATGNLVHAFTQARGDLLALLDDDDAWEPEFLATLVPRFDAARRVGVAFCDYAMVAGDRVFERPWPWTSGIQHDVLPRLLDRSIPPAAALVRREAWLDGEARLPLRPDMAGAASIWLRTAAAGWQFDHVSRTLVRYGLHAGQMTWSAPMVTARWARTLEQLTFDDDVAERMRRARLSEARLTQCGIHLRRGELTAFRREWRAARTLGSTLSARNVLALSGLRRFAARRLPAYPRLLAPVLAGWQRVRPRPG